MASAEWVGERTIAPLRGLVGCLPPAVRVPVWESHLLLHAFQDRALSTRVPQHLKTENSVRFPVHARQPDANQIAKLPPLPEPKHPRQAELTRMLDNTLGWTLEAIFFFFICFGLCSWSPSNDSQVVFWWCFKTVCLEAKWAGEKLAFPLIYAFILKWL